MPNTRGMLFSEQGGPSKAPRSLRIVVADDDRDMVLSLMMLLREEGHDVRGLHSGRPVMAAVIDLDPDVVVLDINLPEVSGWQLASTIRARQTKTQPLLIGISGVFTKGGDKVLAEISGFHHYLLKPCDPSALVALLAPLRSPDAAEEMKKLEAARPLPRARPAGSTPAGEAGRAPLFSIEHDTYRAALVRAAELLGGAVPLSHRLQVPMADLARWLAGDGKPPMGVFLMVIDVLIEEGRKPVLKS